jgi:hypothetical protein
MSSGGEKDREFRFCHLLNANSWGIYAEIEIAQGRFQALQEDGDRESEAGARETASHPDVKGTQNQTETAQGWSGERWRSGQSLADDSVSVRRIVDLRFSIAD